MNTGTTYSKLAIQVRLGSRWRRKGHGSPEVRSSRKVDFYYGKTQALRGISMRVKETHHRH
jgi:hypothetical protein